MVAWHLLLLLLLPLIQESNSCSPSGSGSGGGSISGDCLPRDCTWGDWSQWGPCSGGYQFRLRSKLGEAKCGGKCEGTHREQKSCTGCKTVNCEWGPWSTWSNCDKSVGRQTHSRSKTKTESCGGRCTGSSSQSRICSYDDSKCTALKGNCQMLYKDPCTGGNFVRYKCGGSNVNRRCCVPNTPGTTYTHTEAASKLSAVGINIWSSSTPVCHKRYTSHCTSLEQIRRKNIDELLKLKKASGCTILVTGGTEFPHHSHTGTYTHYNGYKIDLNLATCINNYITKTFKKGTDRGKDKAYVDEKTDIIYYMEWNKKKGKYDHWDIDYRALYTSGGGGNAGSGSTPKPGSGSTPKPGSGSTPNTEDSKCTALKGNCEMLNKDPCTGGNFVRYKCGGSDPDRRCCVPNAPGTTYTHTEAASKLSAVGIHIWSSSTPVCHKRYTSRCTSLEQIRRKNIDELLKLKKASGCTILVTGGTEFPHHSHTGSYTHYNGYKIDLNLATCINNYITTTFKRGTDRGKDKAYVDEKTGIIYYMEWNTKKGKYDHWDIDYRALYNSGGGGNTGSGSTPNTGTYSVDIMKLNPTGCKQKTANQNGLKLSSTLTGVIASQKMVDSDLNDLKKYKDCFVKVGKKYDIHPAVLGAIASRESRGGRILKKNKAGEDGWGDLQNGKYNGYGIMQCDPGASKLACTDHAWNSCDHVEMVTRDVLVKELACVKTQKASKDWLPERQLQGAVAAYNFHCDDVRTWGGLDVGSTNDDYSNDVMARAQHLVNKHSW